ncbi:MAG: death domain-containing protein [Proteobacteria bacterium]|nr:death domain-containing protein [Pseudomonadota bacterium]
MASTVLEDVFGDVDQAKLDQPCQKKHLNKISGSIARWEELAPYLDLDEVEIEDIKEEHNSQKRRRQAMLGKWKEKNGTKATYRKLAKYLPVKVVKIWRKSCVKF